MGAIGNNKALVKYEDPSGYLNRTESMGYNKSGSPFHKFFKGRLDVRFAFAIEG